MNDHAKFTNGHWELPAHARGVAPPVDTVRIPGGERALVASQIESQHGHIDANGSMIRLKDAKHPNEGWTLS